MVWVGWKLDGGLTVGVWLKDRAQTISDLATVLGTTPFGQAFTAWRARRSLSSIDLFLIDALIDQPRMPLTQLVESTGLSPKTLRKHLEQLSRTEIIFIEPRLGALTDSGKLVYQLAVAGRAGISDVRRIMGQAVLLHHTQETPISTCSVGGAT